MGAQLVPRYDPLTTLRSIRYLQSLRLLLYHSKGSKIYWDMNVLTNALTTESFDNALVWKAQPELQITLVSLSSLFGYYGDPTDYKHIRLSTIEDETNEELLQQHRPDAVEVADVSLGS